MALFLPVVVAFLCGLLVFIVLLLWKYPWLTDDFRLLGPIIMSTRRQKSHLKKNKLFIEAFEDQVLKQGSKIGLLFEDEKYSFIEMNQQINKVAHAAMSIGLRAGDTVAILIHNHPTFIWTYLGLAKIGVATAFMNFNLRSKSLLHCFTVSGAKTLIVGTDRELVAAVEDISKDLNNNVAIYAWDDHSNLPEGFKSFTQILHEAPLDNPDRSVRKSLTQKDPLCYIYTSGTTGLPKAAVITQVRGLKGMYMDVFGVTTEDVVYTPLPLYHTAGGLMALGCPVFHGATLALGRKFSATHYFDDCVRYKATVVQYIGEVCRYLNATPPKENDKAHCIRIALGNGLRKDIWQEFQERFNIPRIVEFYGATEGTYGFMNIYGKPGSVGKASPLLRKLTGLDFVKYDYETGEPVRNDAGFCIKADPDEAGLFITPINDFMAFDGYQGQGDLTKSKILRDVYKTGDIYFNSGDILILDEDHFVYFADRIGDTFRWKGENVSTVEVSNIISEIPWIEDANVYGVAIPGQEGRAGMATITTVNQLKVTPDNLEDLFHHCHKLLPNYAIPRFIRIQEEIDVTSTFKHLKIDLVEQGFDPSKVKNCDLYYVDFNTKTYEKATSEAYKAITEGQVRL